MDIEQTFVNLLEDSGFKAVYAAGHYHGELLEGKYYAPFIRSMWWLF